MKSGAGREHKNSASSRLDSLNLLGGHAEKDNCGHGSGHHSGHGSEQWSATSIAGFLSQLDEKHGELLRRIEHTLQEALQGHLEQMQKCRTQGELRTVCEDSTSSTDTHMAVPGDEAVNRAEIKQALPPPHAAGGDVDSSHVGTLVRAAPADGLATVRDEAKLQLHGADAAQNQTESKSAALEDAPTPTDADGGALQTPNRASIRSQRSSTKRLAKDRNPSQGELPSQLPMLVEMHIVEARRLLAADVYFGYKSSDPYCRVLLPKKGEVFRTSTQKRTLDPVWNSICQFKISPEELGEDMEVVLEICDEDVFSGDDVLGRLKVPFSDLVCADGSVTESWFDILPEDDCPHATGKLLLKASAKPDQESSKRSAYFKLQDWGTQNFDEALPSREQMTSCISRCRWLVNSPPFDKIVCSCIFLNAVCMFAELEYHGRITMESIGLAEPGTQSSDGVEIMFDVLNMVFAMVFVVELFCRLVAYGMTFLSKMSNWLDVLIVAASVFDLFGAAHAEMVNLTFLRLVRLTKLTRLLKAAMMASFCDPLRILMNAIASSMHSLFWSFMLLAIVNVVAAMFMTQVLHDTIIDGSRDLEMRRFIYTYYGTMSRTTLTMFQILMGPGTWAAIGRPLIEEVNAAYSGFFVLYVGGACFAIIRIITALFLRQVLQVANTDERLMRNEKIQKQRKYSEGIRSLYEEKDPKGTGVLSLEQFERFLIDPQARAWLSVLELSSLEATNLFQLVNDGEGGLSLDDFLTGAFRLKDKGKQIDMLVLQYESRQNVKTLHNVTTQLEDLRHLCRQLDRWTGAGADEVARPLPSPSASDEHRRSMVVQV